MADFRHPPLEEMVAPGVAGPDDVRVWVRSSPGRHRLVLRPEDEATSVHEVSFEVGPEDDGTGVVGWREAGGEPLRPGRRYELEVWRGDDRVGAGRFETAPAAVADAPETFSIAVLSCHMPFDEDGEESPGALRLLELLEEAFEERNVRRILLVGDQMYADMPSKLSLFEGSHFAEVAPSGRESLYDCSAQEVRALYHRRYRLFWNVVPWQRLLARWSTMPILDDHEIVDNWGSKEEHRAPRCWAVRDGARAAYQDYQGSRVRGRPGELPSSFHYTFDYGPVAGFVMDLRSEKETRGDQTRMYGADQLEDLRAFLRDHADRPVAVLVLSVPILHVPDWMVTAGEKLVGGEGTDPADRWSGARSRACRDELLEVLHAHMHRHPEQRVLIVGGDVHLALASEMRWRDECRPVFQLVASPVTNHQGALWERITEIAPRLKSVIGKDRDLWTEARLLDGDGANPFGGLNAGVVTFRRRTDGTHAMRLEVLSHDDGDPPRLRTVFRSPEL